MSLRPRVRDDAEGNAKTNTSANTGANTTTTAGLLVVPATAPWNYPIVLMPQSFPVPDPHGGPSREESMRTRRRSVLEVPQPVQPPLSVEKPPTPSRPDKSSEPDVVARRGPQPRRLLEGPIVDETLKRGTIVSASISTSGKLLDFVVNLSGGTMIQGIKEFQGAISTSWIFTAGGLNLLKNHNDGGEFDPLSDTRIILRVGVALLVKRVLKIEGLQHIGNIMSFFAFIRTASVFVSETRQSPVYDVMDRIASVPIMIYNAVALMLSNALPQNIREFVARAIDDALGTFHVVRAEMAKQVQALDIMAKRHRVDVRGLPATIPHGEAFRVLKEFGSGCV